MCNRYGLSQKHREMSSAVCPLQSSSSSSLIVGNTALKCMDLMERDRASPIRPNVQPCLETAKHKEGLLFRKSMLVGAGDIALSIVAKASDTIGKIDIPHIPAQQ